MIHGGINDVDGLHTPRHGTAIDDGGVIAVRHRLLKRHQHPKRRRQYYHQQTQEGPS